MKLCFFSFLLLLMTTSYLMGATPKYPKKFQSYEFIANSNDNDYRFEILESPKTGKKTAPFIVKLNKKYTHHMPKLSQQDRDAFAECVAHDAFNFDEDYKFKYLEKKDGLFVFGAVFYTPTPFKKAVAIADEPANYKLWTLKRINESPSGITYFVLLDDLVLDPDTALKKVRVLDLHYTFSFAFLKKKNRMQFEIEKLKSNNDFVTYRAGLYKGFKWVKELDSRLKLLPVHRSGSETYTILHVKGHMETIRLLYEILPIKVIHRQIFERLDTMVDTFNEYAAHYKIPAQ